MITALGDRVPPVPEPGETEPSVRLGSEGEVTSKIAVCFDSGDSPGSSLGLTGPSRPSSLVSGLLERRR